MGNVTRLASLCLLALTSSCALELDTGVPLACRDDGECGSGECSRNGQCAEAGSLIAVRLFWTVNGQPADEASCFLMPELRLAFEDIDTFDLLTYAPVPCELGQIFYNRMHPRYDRLIVTAHDTQGTERERAERLLFIGEPESVFSIDFRPLP